MSQLQLTLFGPPRLVYRGRAVEFSLRKASALFVYLVVTRQPHRRDALAALFWPEDSQSQARANVRRTLYRITEALDKDVLMLTSETVELNPQTTIDLDIAAFHQHVADCLPRHGLAHQLSSERLERLVAAAALYTDDFMAGFSLLDSPQFDEWQFFQRESLRQMLFRVLEQLTYTHLEQAEYADALLYARRRLALDTLHEPAHRQLMQLYAWSGQQAAALRQYEECVRILAEELGAPPEEETTALFETIRARRLPPPQRRADEPIEQGTAATVSTEPPANGADRGAVTSPALPHRVDMEREPPTATMAPHNLPAQLTPFIGRANELAEIRQHFLDDSAYRLLTLCGPGGIGKTRLALAAGADLLTSFTDGVWLAELAPLADPHLVAQSVVHVLGLPDLRDRTALATLCEQLRPKQLLLLLDNCEHLIDACAQLADTLLRGCPRLRIIATSREALGIAGEIAFHVAPLTLPDFHTLTATDLLAQSEAAQLFVERARVVLPGFRLTNANAAAVAQVCYRLDGIPLAIELAAARMRILRVEQIAARLDDRFQLLTGGSRMALPRHQTLRALIDWSYDLLAEPERILFQRLSIFAGGWTLAAAEAVCATSETGRKRSVERASTTTPAASVPLSSLEVLDLLGQLVNKSLVVADRQQGEETRYRLLESLRQYAREKLSASGYEEEMRRQHLAYFLVFATRAEPELRGPNQVVWMDRLETELDNLRAALDWSLASDVVCALRLATSLLWFWHIRGHSAEGRDWLARGLAADLSGCDAPSNRSERVLTRATALHVAGYLAHMQGELGPATALLEEALALLRNLGQPGKQCLARVLLDLSGVVLKSGDVERSRSLSEESLALFREVGARFDIAQCLNGLGQAVFMSGDHTQAQGHWEEYLSLSREVGDLDGVADALAHLGSLAYWQDDLVRARLLYEESIMGFRKLDNRWASSYVLISLAVVAWAEGNYKHAERQCVAALALGRQLENQNVLANALYELGGLARACGNFDLATAQYEQMLMLAREMDNPDAIAAALAALGDVACEVGDGVRAADAYEQVMALGRKCGRRPILTAARFGQGKVACAQDDYPFAYSIYAELLQQRACIASPWSALWRRDPHPSWGLPPLLESLAIVMAAMGELERAGHLFAATAAWHDAVHYMRSPGERGRRAGDIDVVRTELGEQSFSAIWAKGAAMTLDEAVIYAQAAR